MKLFDHRHTKYHIAVLVSNVLCRCPTVEACSSIEYLLVFQTLINACQEIIHVVSTKSATTKNMATSVDAKKTQASKMMLTLYLYVQFYLCYHQSNTYLYSVTISGIFFYQIQLDGLGHPPCFKDLQLLEQDGLVPPSLSSFGKKILHIWSHRRPTTDNIYLIIYILVFPV